MTVRKDAKRTGTFSLFDKRIAFPKRVGDELQKNKVNFLPEAKLNKPGVMSAPPFFACLTVIRWK